MRFRLIDQAKNEFPVARLCKVLGVSQSGYFAWKTSRQSQAARGHDAVGACSLRLLAVGRNVWEPAHDAGSAR